MSDTPTTDDTAAWLENEVEDTIQATISREDGPDLPIEVIEPTESDLDDLDAIKDSVDGAEGRFHMVNYAIDEYLVDPEVDPEDIGVRKRNLLWTAMQKAWTGAEEIQAAMEEMPVEGNRR